jgi:hypothetical protein
MQLRYGVEYFFCNEIIVILSGIVVASVSFCAPAVTNGICTKPIGMTGFTVTANLRKMFQVVTIRNRKKAMMSGNITSGYWQVNTVVRRGTASAAAIGWA